VGGIEGFSDLIGFALNVDIDRISLILNRASSMLINAHSYPYTFKMCKTGGKTGMVSPPKVASKECDCRYCKEYWPGMDGF